MILSRIFKLNYHKGVPTKKNIFPHISNVVYFILDAQIVHMSEIFSHCNIRHINILSCGFVPQVVPFLIFIVSVVRMLVCSC